MDYEFILLMSVLGIALASVLTARRSRLLVASLIAIWIASGIMLKPVVGSYRSAHAVVTPTNRPVERLREEYVSSKECGACHPREYHTWKNTWHRTMTQAASPEAVIGDFNNVELDNQGWTTVLKRRGDQFFASLPDRELKKSVEHEVVLTTGSHHMQAYWYSRGVGAPLGQLPFTFLKHDQKWVPRDAIFIKPPMLIPGDETGRWNANCIHCHTTRGRPGIQGVRTAEGITFTKSKSDAVEFGIACESCHGPGGEHTSKYRSNPVTRYAKYFSDVEGDDSIANPARMTKARSVEVCGQCHGISRYPKNRMPILDRGYQYRPGERLEQGGRSIVRRTADSGALETPESAGTDGVEPNLDQYFWLDGQVRVRGRELNGLYESPCFEKGEMTCLSCHTLHKSDDDPRDDSEWANDMLGHGGQTEEACLNCHSTYERDVEAHTRHDAGSSGSACMNCHMPYTTWGLMNGLRQHTINSPTVAASLETGRPNACNACHIDQTLGWAATHLNEWYGQPLPTLSDEQEKVAASLLWLLKGDAGQRALAAWYLGWEPAKQVAGRDWIATQLAPLLEDPYAVVRYVAAKSLQSLPGFEGFEYDYVGPTEDRGPAKRKVWKQYTGNRAAAREATGTMDPARAERLLLYPDGISDRGAVNQLLEQRDDHDMLLAE